MDVDAQSRRLQHRAQGLSIALISRETVLLSRLLYRNKSQHRREIAYQKSVRVSHEGHMTLEITLAFENRLPP